MPFPLAALPVELVITIFAFAVQSSASSYCALSLVSRATRSIVLNYAILDVPVNIPHLKAASSFQLLTSTHPDVALRIRGLQLLYWAGTIRDRKSGAHEVVRSIMRSCLNITTLTTSSVVIHNTINDLPSFELHKTQSLHLDCVNLESTRDINRHPNSQALLSQITHLFGKFGHVQLFEVLVPYEGATWSFKNLTHFACLAPRFPEEFPRIQLLLDQTLFPVLEQIVFGMTKHSSLLPPRAAGVSERAYKYRLLKEAKEWDKLYLAFDAPTGDFHDMMWSEGMRLVDYGGDDLIDPPDWPDEDIFTYGESMVNLPTGENNESDVTIRGAVDPVDDEVDTVQTLLEGGVPDGVSEQQVESEDDDIQADIAAISRKESGDTNGNDPVRRSTSGRVRLKKIWRFLVKTSTRLFLCR